MLHQPCCDISYSVNCVGSFYPLYSLQKEKTKILPAEQSSISEMMLPRSPREITQLCISSPEMWSLPLLVFASVRFTAHPSSHQKQSFADSLCKSQVSVQLLLVFGFGFVFGIEHVICRRVHVITPSRARQTEYLLRTAAYARGLGLSISFTLGARCTKQLLF